MTDPNGIFENDADGGLTDFGKRLVETSVEAFEDKIAEDHDELVEVFDAYMDQEVRPMIEEAVEDSVSEIRKLMLLAVSTIAGLEKTREFINKVAALARAGSLSSATGEWAAGGPADASQNRQTVAGGSGTLRKEKVEKAQARAVFNEVAAGLDENQTEEFMSLVEDMEFRGAGDGPRLRAALTEIRNRAFVDKQVTPYLDAISRTIRKS